MTAAFRQILEQTAPRTPNRLQADKGKEFFNTSFTNLMRRHVMQQFASESDMKAAVAERFNRTIKPRICTYLSDRGNVRWFDVIDQLVDTYNHSRHRSIGMTQADVEKKDENMIWTRLYGDGDTHLKPPIAHGAMVRSSKHKVVFDKGYMPNWSKEHFIILETPEVKRGTKHRVYKIQDYNGEPVKDLWYPKELQQITDNQY